MTENTFKDSPKLDFTIKDKTFTVGIYTLPVDNQPRIMLWEGGSVVTESPALTEALSSDLGGTSGIAKGFVERMNKNLERILGDAEEDTNDEVWEKVLKFLGEHLAVNNERFVIR